MSVRVQSDWITHTLLMGIQRSTIHTWENTLAAYHKAKYVLYHVSRPPLPRYFQKCNENIYLHKDLYVNAQSSIIHVRPKLETTKMPIDRWMSQQNVICPYNKLLVDHKKRKEVVINVITWMNLENVMENERREWQKTTYCKISYMWNVQNGQIIKTESKWVIARGWSERRVRSNY